MNSFRVTNENNLSKLTPTGQQKLRTGQLVQGKIIKLFPKNKAVIQLGSERMIASLEVGLEVGGRYHFRVQSMGDVIQLKVLGEQLKAGGEADVSRLLQQLGMKETRANVNLLSNLIRLKIPFDQRQLLEAGQLLKGDKNKAVATQVLIEMIAKKLPIKSSIFQALSGNGNTSLNDQLKAVIQQMNVPAQPTLLSVVGQKATQVNAPLKESIQMTEANLANTIATLINKPQTFKDTFVKEVLNQNAANNQTLFRMFQGLGLVKLDVNFPQWVTEWVTFAGVEKVSSTNSQSQLSSLPFNIKEQEILLAFSKLNEQKPSFEQAVRTFLNQWDKQLNFLDLIKGKMTKEDFTQITSDIKRDIIPYLNEKQQMQLSQLTNTQQGLSAFYAAIKAIGNGQSLSNFTQLIETSRVDEQFLASNPKQQFLQQLKLHVSSLGLDYENQLATKKNPTPVTQTIKGLLLQLISSSDFMQPEAPTKLLHLINGMQLQSVNETPTMIQANLQIPAERLGLVKDLELEFEGKKNEDGKINPDHCRILFYLELGNLKETIIDMNIQKRAISVTVFNNNEAIQAVGNIFKERLDKNFEGMNYKLSALHFKKLEEREKEKPVTERNIMDQSQQGVDFRI